MSPLSSATRRDLFNAGLTASEAGPLTRHRTAAVASDTIRRFNVDITDEQLADLRQRIAATRWPEKEAVADQFQGIEFATMLELASYSATDYDWRRGEAKLQTFPQSFTEIDKLNNQPAIAISKTSATGELTRDEILDNITLYWLSNTGVSASCLYWEYIGGFSNSKGVPVAVSAFHGEQYEARRSRPERAYPKLIHYNGVEKGGHFTARE
ncbi:hypothetical protein GHK53_29090 [Sinorhizobium meliloti]|uniref:Epoxide hydrolase N-terminal domain-containing protein n=1 Tax=Rhizobium meliloti TaxID=382 RepID=A0AAW9TXL1_RHIML|nr:epoxide hydrolase N-terminal domain-containing protein [Sinorhizobium meliloti]MQW36723.1 hypothetical protein [Sinorhizobium meliloti]